MTRTEKYSSTATRGQDHLRLIGADYPGAGCHQVRIIGDWDARTTVTTSGELTGDYGDYCDPIT